MEALPAHVEKDLGTPAKRGHKHRRSISGVTAFQLTGIAKAQGIEVNGPLEMRDPDVTKFAALEVPLGDPIYSKTQPDKGALSTISYELQLPIMGRRLTAVDLDPSFDGVTGNFDASMLFQNVDLDAPEPGDPGTIPSQCFGEISSYFSNAGKVLLVRQDTKPLHELHAQALIAFARDFVTERIYEYNTERRVVESHSEFVRLDDATKASDREGHRYKLVHQLVTKDEFKYFFEQYRYNRVHGVSTDIYYTSTEADWEHTARPDWVDVPSPYEI